MKSRILVLGGAGYIGSHMTKVLGLAGYEVTVLDNLSSGIRENVLCDDFVQGDICDATLLSAIFKTRKIAAVMHFVAHIDVGESVRNPAKYYENNLGKTITLLNSMVEHDVKRIIFSSTCSVYGLPEKLPLTEAEPLKPINPYGWSKMMVEQILKSYETAHDFRSYRLRYFNACGADPDGQIGECHDPETHLIPICLRVAAGKIPTLNILGDDYPTADGTGIRDYIHVMDLCNAHLYALRDLLANGVGGEYNVGLGRGYSVKEVIATVEAVTKLKVNTRISARRPGEPPMLVADPAKIMSDLGWTPRWTELSDMVQHAWAWECR